MVPLLQEILAWLGPHVEENQQNHGQEEGSHHGDTHMLGQEKEGGHDCEHSHTPPSGREHFGRGRDRDDRALLQIDMMQDLQRSKPPLFYDQGTGLQAKTWLLDMGHCFSLLPYGSNVKAHCANT